MRFEIRRRAVPATYGGLFGGKPDRGKVYVAGVAVYVVDGKEVSKEEFKRLQQVDEHARSAHGQRGDI